MTTIRVLLCEECVRYWLGRGEWPSPAWDKPGIYIRARCPKENRFVSAYVLNEVTMPEELEVLTGRGT